MTEKYVKSLIDKFKENVYAESGSNNLNEEDSPNLVIPTQYRVKNAFPYFCEKDSTANSLISEYKKEIKSNLEKIKGLLPIFSDEKGKAEFHLIADYTFVFPSDISYFLSENKIPLKLYDWKSWGKNSLEFEIPENLNTSQVEKDFSKKKYELEPVLIVEVPSEEYIKPLDDFAKAQLKELFEEKKKKGFFKRWFLENILKKFKGHFKVSFYVADPLIHSFNAPKISEERPVF